MSFLHMDVSALAASGGPGMAGVLLLALVLGARHATDADHLAAVYTLVLDDRAGGWRSAGLLGLWWGLGHGASMFALGLPLALFGNAIPEWIARAAEVGVGILIAALAARLLLRWRRGDFQPQAHDHHRPRARPRSPLASLGVGLVHGVGGSAGAGVLMVAAIPGTAASVLALGTLAVATALAMGGAALGLGYFITRGRVSAALPRLVPVLAVGGVAFGIWFAVQA